MRVRRCCHCAARYLGVPVRDGDSMFLVQTKQELRPLVSKIVDDAVVQTSEARARVDRDVGNVERTKGVRDNVAAEDHIPSRNRNRPLDLRIDALFGFSVRVGD
jgi:hypothetical protein